MPRRCCYCQGSISPFDEHFTARDGEKKIVFCSRQCATLFSVKEAEASGLMIENWEKE